MRPAREELIEVMARADWTTDKSLPWDIQPEHIKVLYRDGMVRALAGLEAHGVRLVPLKMTKEMLTQAEEGAMPFGCQEAAYDFSLAASPYAPSSNDEKEGGR